MGNLLNSFGDVLFGIFGWLFAMYIDKNIN